MKKIVAAGLLLCLGSAFTGAISQSLEFNAKGTFNSTWMFNPNISNDGEEQDMSMAWGYHYGGGLTFFFSKSLGIGADLIVSRHNIRYEGVLPGSISYKSSVALHATEIPILFKIKSNMGGFVELGASFGSLKKADYKYSSGSLSTSGNVKSEFTSSYTSAVFGMGANLKASKRLAIPLGFRFFYSITDVKGVDAFGLGLKNPALYPAVYPKEEASHLFSAGLFLGLAWTIGKVHDD